MYTVAARPRKRNTQDLLTSRINNIAIDYSSLRKGTIIVLSGPEPEKAIQYYKQYDLYENCLLVEKDYKQLLRALIQWDEDLTLPQLRKIYRQPTKSITLAPGLRMYYEDVFDLAPELTQNVQGIDLDLCQTLQPELVDRICYLLSNIDTSTYWLRLTTSYRGICKAIIERRIDQIRSSMLYKTGYIVIDEHSCGYRDGSPMNCWQVVVTKQTEYTPARLREHPKVKRRPCLEK